MIVLRSRHSKFLHFKHKWLAVCVIGGLCLYGGISLIHAHNVDTYHPDIKVVSYRRRLQNNLNQLGRQDIDKARVEYNHKTHQLIFNITDYDSIREFQKSRAQSQTNYFSAQTHTRNITYDIHVLPSAIKQHKIQMKEQQEQIQENKAMIHKQRVAEKKAQLAQKKQAQQQAKKQRYLQWKHRQQAKKKHGKPKRHRK